MTLLIREYCSENKTGFSVLSSHWKKLCSTNAIPNIGHDAYVTGLSQELDTQPGRWKCQLMMETWSEWPAEEPTLP